MSVFGLDIVAVLKIDVDYPSERLLQIKAESSERILLLVF
jgi:hypothetical protein